MKTITQTMCACLLGCLAAQAASGANIKANIVVAPPGDGMAYQVGEQVPVSIWLRGETVPVDDLELVQVDLQVTGAVIPDADGDGFGDVSFAPFGPDGLPGSAATSYLGSVPSAVGGGRIYFWFRTTTNPAHLFDLPASDPGRQFINFSVLLNVAGDVFVNALGPCINDGSSSGAFASDAPGGLIYTNCDSDPTRNWVQGVPGGPAGGGDEFHPGIMFTVVPEPAGLGLLALGVLALVHRRRF
jgi:hypothetical protein